MLASTPTEPSMHQAQRTLGVVAGLWRYPVKSMQGEALEAAPLPQGDLPRDLGILRTLTAHSAAPSVTLAPGVVFPAVAGIYATMAQGGLLRRGDRVFLMP